MALTLYERSKIYHHMGYTQVVVGQTFVFGIPAGVQVQFSIKGAMDVLQASAEEEVRRHLRILEKLEEQMVDDLELLAMSKADEIEFRPDEHKLLKKEYVYWQGSLGNLFGCIPNPFDMRNRSGGINVPTNNY